MRRFILLIAMAACAVVVKAQTVAQIPATEPFGKVSNADLELKSCDFEKDANAEVLFEKVSVSYDDAFNIVEEYHKRIKIFSDNPQAKGVADVRIEFYGGNRSEAIGNLQAETINMVNGKPEITKLDKKVLYLQHIDKNKDAYVFSMPNVRAGSVIEYKYQWTSPVYYNFPDFYFQQKLPVRYSELSTEIPEQLYFRTDIRTRMPFVKDVITSGARSSGGGADMVNYTVEKHVRAMANIPSLRDEPYMRSDVDNLQGIIFQLAAIKPLGGFNRSLIDSWSKVGGALIDDEDFGSQFKRKVPNEEVLLGKAAVLKSNDEKIAYLFSEVRNNMKWNDIDRWYTNDGTSKAWETKTGNSTEINLILYHLLKKSGVKAYPMIVSTREHGRVNPYYPSLYQFNRAVVYIPVDSTHRYVLDASSKYNVYNEIPGNLLNSSGLYVDKEENTYDIVLLKKDEPVRQVVLINAEIKPDGKMSGTVQLNSFSYNRMNAIRRYKTDGEKKYIDYLAESDNNLKISELKFKNMEVDTLPLTQNMDFAMDLTGSDGTYIYFSPNLFTSLHNNPFLSESRATDIDYGYRNSYSINGIYKIPAGYKIDAMPKSASMTMSDNSIIFKRIVAEQDGSVIVRYSIVYKNALFVKENYPEFHDFFKKMHEMLNEQIVLKKG